jgi:site-specific recombinase XerD
VRLSDDFDDQRHIFASMLARKGINAFTLRDLLGHTTIRTTNAMHDHKR